MRAGVWYCAGAYFLWALFPLYFRLLVRSGALEIIAARIFFSFVVCVLALLLLRQWRSFRELLRDRRVVLVMSLAGVLIAVNWTAYVYGVNTGRTLDAALGYFINPLVAAVLGVVVLGERLNRIQWVAFGIGAVASVVLIIGYGQVPWIAFILAISFGSYGLVKKRVGGRVPVLHGLTMETAALTPIALAYVGYLVWTSQLTAHPTETYGWLVYLAGPVTVVPLLLFAAGAARVQLVTLGMLQYIAPIGQFLVGWLVFNEPMPAARWAGFVLVWLSVALFFFSAWRTWRLTHRPVMDRDSRGLPPPRT